MTHFPKLTDMLPRRDTWRTIADYAVYSRQRGLIISPYLLGFKHVEASHYFDSRFYNDWKYGLNRAAKYIPARGKRP